jgi:hypothetical protein
MSRLGANMRRREFIAALGGAAVAWQVVGVIVGLGALRPISRPALFKVLRGPQRF